MKKIVIDCENTTTKLNEKYSDYSPYNSSNKLVSIGWCFIEDGIIKPIKYVFLHHTQLAEKFKEDYYITGTSILLELFKKELKEAEVVVAHNAKYDIQWLEECGFGLSHLKIEDTMIREYVMARGRGDISFRLADTCKRYGVAEKGELFEKYPDLQISEMPIAEVEEYGRADVQACAELYIAQEKRLAQDSYKPLHKTIEMSNEFCRVLADIERRGVKIDEIALRKVEKEFTEEADKLKYELTTIVKKVMGDTPVNLDSPQQLSEVIYSRRIKRGMEDTWVSTFNIGKDERNKNLKRPKMSFHEYAQKVKTMCHTVMKTEVQRCTECQGQGKYCRIKKDGTEFKKPFKCKVCNGVGGIYKDLNEIAGFKFRPENVHWTTVGGFSTSQTFLTDLLAQARERNDTEAHDFIEKLMRLSSVSSYLSNFVGGISVFKQADNILHANFNQCITATGRLSSTKPNLQNMPRESTFPIRRVFISRFEGGKIIDTDFCVSPDTKILTASLVWKKAKDIVVGEELIGFNEFSRGHRGLYLKPSMVEKVKPLIKECVRICTDKGAVECSKDHMWLARWRNKPAKWVKSEELTPEHTISYYTDTWEGPKTEDDFWMSGFLDGEGWIYQTGGGFGQNNCGDNKLCLDRAIKICKDRNINLSFILNKKVMNCRTTGCQQGMALVGKFRPVRLLAKSRSLWENKSPFGKRSTPAKIKSVINIGRQVVRAIQTSTKTFIAEGMLSHNCQLEFRTAVHLAKDERGKKDILDGKDIHQQTCEIITNAGQSTTRQQAKRHCVPDFTRIFTKEGFKRHFEVKIGDLVLTHNIKTGYNEWQPLVAKTFYKREDVYVLHNSHTKLYSTLDHKWVGQKVIETSSKRHRTRELRTQFFTTNDVNSSYRLLRSAPTSGYTENTFWDYVKIIDDTENYTTLKLVDELHKEKAINELVLQGCNIRTYKHRPNIIKLLKNSYTNCKTLERTPVGKMNVWCPTVENGTWVMQQGNYISITGNTFKPLYAGQSGTEAEKAYYKKFLSEIYTGIGAWHKSLEEEAIKYKMITLETGRQYLFPNAERAWHGGAIGKTQIVNFPVQGEATGDLVPIACIKLYSEMRKLNLKSRIVLLVHDSCVVDAHPDEIEVVIGLMKQLGKYAEQEAKLRYDIDMYVPLQVETKIGENAMELQKVA